MVVAVLSALRLETATLLGWRINFTWILPAYATQGVITGAFYAMGIWLRRFERGRTRLAFVSFPATILAFCGAPTSFSG